MRRLSETPTSAWITGWSPSGLGQLSAAMGDAAAAGDPFQLDLSDAAIAGESSPSAVRVNTASAMVLSNLLVGHFRQAPVRVTLPKSRALNLQLARSGLFFALSNRPAVGWEDAPAEWQEIARAWTHPFHPSDATMLREALATQADVGRDGWLVRAAFQRYLLSVVHPHERPGASLREDIQRIARRWLSSRLNVEHGSQLVNTLLDSAEVLYEIVVNVADHAGIAARSSGASLGQLYATLGGGRESHNRLHFSVLDNGVGMPQRVNERFVDTHRDAQRALSDSVMGLLPRRSGGRGIGLHRVHQIADQYSTGEDLTSDRTRSSMRIVSTGDRLGDAVELQWHNGEPEPTTAVLPGVPVQGTIVSVSLGLEQRTTVKDDSDQLELSFTDPDTAAAS